MYKWPNELILKYILPYNTADTKLEFGIYLQICANAFFSISYYLHFQ